MNAIPMNDSLGGQKVEFYPNSIKRHISGLCN
jgi:hypothetical protein